jgi:hypothetical protein
VFHLPFLFRIPVKYAMRCLSLAVALDECLPKSFLTFFKSSASLPFRFRIYFEANSPLKRTKYKIFIQKRR